MDTARYKYPPFWVDLEKLYQSSRSLDEESGKLRGLIVLSNKVKQSCSVH